jgi:hypothetical protein
MASCACDLALGGRCADLVGTMSGTTKPKADGPAATGAVRPALARRQWRAGPEAIALGVLLAGAGVGLVLWAKWGLLIALQTVAIYCF